MQGVTVPSQVRAQEPFKVQALVHSTEPARGRLIIMRNGVLLRESAVELEPGANVYTFVEQADEPGLRNTKRSSTATPTASRRTTAIRPSCR